MGKVNESTGAGRHQVAALRAALEWLRTSGIDMTGWVISGNYFALNASDEE